MTKSSAARIDRRLHKKDVEKKTKKLLKGNRCWDELEQLNSATAAILFSAHHILPILKDTEIVKRAGEELIPLATIINKDIELYQKQFTDIHDKHRDKTGAARNFEDGRAAIIIGQEYVQLHESFELVVAPNIQQVIDIAKRVATAIDEETDTTAAPKVEVVETPAVEEQNNV